jgi:hypothetical protein
VSEADVDSAHGWNRVEPKLIESGASLVR